MGQPEAARPPLVEPEIDLCADSGGRGYTSRGVLCVWDPVPPPVHSEARLAICGTAQEAVETHRCAAANSWLSGVAR